jgi:hypothetical protein
VVLVVVELALLMEQLVVLAVVEQVFNLEAVDLLHKLEHVRLLFMAMQVETDLLLHHCD